MRRRDYGDGRPRFGDRRRRSGRHLPAQPGQKVGVVSIKLLQPFPEAEVVAALKGKKAVTVLERSDQTALTTLVTQALFKGAKTPKRRMRHEGIPAIKTMPRLTTAIFGLGGHDLQPRHLIAAFKNMEGKGQQRAADLSRLAVLLQEPVAAHGRTAEAHEGVSGDRADGARNRRQPAPAAGFGLPRAFPLGRRLRHDRLGQTAHRHPRRRARHALEVGAEIRLRKSGAPTNFYITLSPEPIKITNAELEDVEVVISPDHRAFSHTNPLRPGCRAAPSSCSRTRRPKKCGPSCRRTGAQDDPRKKINFFIIDAFAVAKRNAPTPNWPRA